MRPVQEGGVQHIVAACLFELILNGGSYQVLNIIKDEFMQEITGNILFRGYLYDKLFDGISSLCC
ncbi:MAG: hypothetical protein ACTS73_09895 [Arsenophonus sp. NEOnobi-MAG3]